jgi:hypothetical protein
MSAPTIVVTGRPAPPPLYDLRAQFADGSLVERGSGTPYEFVARSARGKLTWHRSLSAAERAAGKRGMAAKVSASSARYEAWLSGRGYKITTSATPLFGELRGHSCNKRHQTYHALAKCRWPRPVNAEHVFGEGRYGVYIERDEYYPDHDGMPGAPAVWPDIHLVKSADEAQDLHAQLTQRDSNIRRSYVFQLPADPGDAEYEDRTIHGNRRRYANG